MKDPTQCRTNSQHVEVIARDFVIPALVSCIFYPQPSLLHSVGQQVSESCVPFLEIDIVGIGLVLRSVALLHHVVEVLGLWDIKWAQHERVQHAERNHVRANAQCQPKYGGNRESRRLAQLPRAVMKMAVKRVENHFSIDGGHTFLHDGWIPETDQCVASSLCSRHPLGEVVGDAHFEMRLDLSFDLALEFGTRE